MSDKKCFFFPSSLSKNNFVTTAMKRFLDANKKKTIHFFINHFDIQLVLFNRM